MLTVMVCAVLYVAANALNVLISLARGAFLLVIHYPFSFRFLTDTPSLPIIDRLLKIIPEVK